MVCKYVAKEYTGKLWKDISSQEASRDMNHRAEKQGFGSHAWGGT